MTNHVSKLHDKIPTYPIYNTVAGVRQESGVEPSVLLQCNGGTENLVNVVKFLGTDGNRASFNMLRRRLADVFSLF